MGFSATAVHEQDSHGPDDRRDEYRKDVDRGVVARIVPGPVSVEDLAVGDPGLRIERLCATLVRVPSFERVALLGRYGKIGDGTVGRDGHAVHPDAELRIEHHQI